jgi:hypothetical protein
MWHEVNRIVPFLVGAPGSLATAVTPANLWANPGFLLPVICMLYLLHMVPFVHAALAQLPTTWRRTKTPSPRQLRTVCFWSFIQMA